MAQQSVGTDLAFGSVSSLALFTSLNQSTMVSGNYPAKSAKRLNRGRWAHLRSGVTVACPRRLFAYWKYNHIQSNEILTKISMYLGWKEKGIVILPARYRKSRLA
jgi:hypothetical protein